MDVRSRIWTMIVILVLDAYVISACSPGAVAIGTVVVAVGVNILLSGHDNCGPCKYNINF